MAESTMIHNGDHLQFEIDHADTPKEERPDWPLPSFDAMEWAKAFNKRHPAVSVDDALGWFANALMRGHDEGRERAAKGSPTVAAIDSSSDEDVREFLGWLKADLAALGDVEVPTLVESWERYQATRPRT